MATFYEGPYVMADGQHIKAARSIGSLKTTSRALTTAVAKTLSRAGRGVVITAHVLEKGFTVRASNGRVVKLPAAILRAQRNAKFFSAKKKTSRKR